MSTITENGRATRPGRATFLSGQVVILCLLAGITPSLEAQETAMADPDDIEEVIAIGTRGQPRTASDSPVPVEAIRSEELLALGNSADLTDNLKMLVPSYTATPATGDGSAFVRPTSLRGTASDQTLVLVDGKRRHRSALVQFFAPAAGNGAHGVDIGMIPSIALERVEVLKDGAASQYGSDAIAGVINFVTKSDREGGQVTAQWGKFFDGENSMQIAANVGLPLGETGFLNLSIERIDNDALSRGIQRPDAQALIDQGLPVGLDAPFGDAPLAQTWGRPQSAATRFFASAGIDVSDDDMLYLRVGAADAEGRYRFFYRNPQHSSLVPLRAMGFTGLTGGYTPFLDGDQSDLSVVGGFEGITDGGVNFDFSIGYGRNELDYFLNNTINPDLGLAGGNPAQRDFDVGGYEQEELNLNADFAMSLADNMGLGFGLEFREETYTAVAGEPASYQGAGSNGLKGIAPQDAGAFERDNWAIYADIEHDINESLMLQYAARYEDFSDFGGTFNGKLAGLVRVNDRLSLRGAVSTGFHAPTPGQANVRTTITTFDGVTGLQVEEGLVPSTDPRVATVGGTELTEEKSTNFSAGFALDIGDNTTMTADYYHIAVDDRIYRTGDIAVPVSTNTISFYTNALDVEHSGIDLVVTSAIDWTPEVTTTLTFSYNHNRIDVVSQSLVGGVQPVSDGLVEDIENNYPENRFTVTAVTGFSPEWTLMVRGTFYGEHYDERGRIGAASAPSALIDSTLYIDAELAYEPNDKVRIALGAVNIFDEFIDTIGPPNSNRLSVGLQYPRRSAANYEGGSLYLKGNYFF